MPDRPADRFEYKPDIARTHSYNRELTNLDYIDPNLIREPDYFIYVFSVADRHFEIHRPSLNISTLKTAYNQKAMTDPTAYQIVWKVPSPYPLPYADQNSGQIKLESVRGEQAAMDICNPNQKSTNMDGYIQPEGVIGLGDDLISKGLFFVRDSECTYAADDKDKKFPIPPAKYVADAVERKRKYYNSLLDRAKELEYSDQASLAMYIKSEPDLGLACEYFGIETSWRQVRTQKAVPVECPVCGTDMKRGASFHPLPGSRLGVCVNNWDAAIAAGVVTEDDRPGAKKAKVTA